MTKFRLIFLLDTNVIKIGKLTIVWSYPYSIRARDKESVHGCSSAHVTGPKSDNGLLLRSADGFSLIFLLATSLIKIGKVTRVWSYPHSLR